MDERVESDAPTGWPANQPPGGSPLAESDRAAGFEIGPDFRRFSQRDEVFNRAWWDEAVMSDDVAAFYDAQRNPKPRRGEGFSQWDFALRNAAWALAWDYAWRGQDKGIREGFMDPFDSPHPTAPTRVEGSDPETNAARVKEVARLLGAGLVGITEYDERWVYTHRADIATRTREEKPNPMPDGLTSVIVLGHEMDYELVRTYPSALAGAATGREYSHEAAMMVQLSSFIRGLGYQAVASSNDTALTIPYAIKAGLGEYGRNQMVITREFGPRVRFSKIFTDLPLAHDAPRRNGSREFCDICTRCADACPPKALPYGPPTPQGPNRSSIRGVTKWTADCEKCFGYWTKMRSDCAICMRVCPFNKDYSRWPMRAFRWLAGGRLRRAALWLDGRLGFGDRVRPSQWWARLTGDAAGS